MGLPDFHGSRGSYTQLVRDDDVVAITDLLENTIFTYIGYGEIIETYVNAIEDTIALSDNDIVRLYIDGVQVHAANIADYLAGNFDSGHSLIIPTYFNPYDRFHFSLARGIFFNNTIRLTYQKFNIGDINVGLTWSIGAY